MAAVILKEVELPVESMTGLVDAASKEGHTFVLRLLSEWNSGKNRFKDRGETFLLAWDKGVVVGMVGLLRESAGGGKGMGRLVHLYVTPANRGRGIGRELCKRALSFAPKTFSNVVVKAPSGPALRVFEGQGFVRVFGRPNHTHELAF
jgi:GNAT superfamily N-acetyltransferase